MVIYNIKIAPEGELSTNLITVGRYNENDAVQVTFDISSWQEIFGDQEVRLVLQLPEHETLDQIYPPVDENIVTWTISDYETADVGIGQAELQYYSGSELLIKSAILTIQILEAIESLGPMPCPCQPVKEENKEFYLSTVIGEYRTNE